MSDKSEIHLPVDAAPISLTLPETFRFALPYARVQHPERGTQLLPEVWLRAGETPIPGHAIYCMLLSSKTGRQHKTTIQGIQARDCYSSDALIPSYRVERPYALACRECKKALSCFFVHTLVILDKGTGMPFIWTLQGMAARSYEQLIQRLRVETAGAGVRLPLALRVTPKVITIMGSSYAVPQFAVYEITQEDDQRYREYFFTANKEYLLADALRGTEITEEDESF